MSGPVVYACVSVYVWLGANIDGMGARHHLLAVMDGILCVARDLRVWNG